MLLITTLDSTDSTNAYLKNLILTKKSISESNILIDIPEFYTVRAGFQSNGRGQKENVWHSEPNKNILLSTLLYPSFLAENQFDVNIAICLGLIDFCKKIISPEGFSIKWPNDIYYLDQKIGGILIEHTISGNSIVYSVVGIGLNINQISFPDSVPNPISALMIKNNNYNIDYCVRELLSCLISRYEMISSEINSMKEEYKSYLFRMDTPSTFIHDNREIIASIVDVNKYGLLCLKTSDDAQIECGFKEISYII